MLQKENRYDFRKRMLEIHKPNIRKADRTPNDNEFVIENGVVIGLPENPGIVVETAAKDLVDYLNISMNMPSMVVKGAFPGAKIRLTFAKDTGVDLGDVAGYMGYKIDTTDDGIDICAFDERGAAQAFYRLEEMMSLRKAPYIEKGTVKNKAMFAPRMVHSGYRMDEFPDEHLAAIAHAGMDTILVFVKDVDVTPYGFLGFNELIYRAEKYGIDAYVYSYLDCEMHPDDEGAEEYFDGLYGKIFKACPKFKGIILVGESCEFPSKDPNTSGLSRHACIDNDPTGNPYCKPSPGYWPSLDYPDWLNMVKKSIRKYTPEADIVFWSYNWGYAPEADRIKLIEILPKDVSLLVTWEMFQMYPIGDNVMGHTGDYTLAQVGPGKYFTSEAVAAKKAGIKLYTMANTGGLTWDIGVIPYWPTPFQWIKRYKALIEARDNWGLCGIMESHHYGLYPSFISQLTKAAYSDFNKPMEECLRDIIKINFTDDEKEVDIIIEALEKWSEGITYHPTSNEDQAGPNRLGPAYALCLPQSGYKQAPPEHATAKSGWYYQPYKSIDRGRCSILGRRISNELRRAKQALQLFKDGVEILERVPKPNEELERLINMGKYICHCEQTIVHTKEWFIRGSKLQVEQDPKVLMQYVDELVEIAKAEIENAKACIPYLEVDSRLGWEPSMEYIGTPDRIAWKEKLMTYILNGELTWYRKAIELDL